jgi:hypothetical protein
MQDMERRGSSHLRHEVTDRPPRKEDISDGARAILKVRLAFGEICMHFSHERN